MTPKEKANYLVDDFINRTRNRFERESLSYRRAKVCALITLLEIIKVVKVYNDTQAEYTYWEEVKEEIEKL